MKATTRRQLFRAAGAALLGGWVVWTGRRARLAGATSAGVCPSCPALLSCDRDEGVAVRRSLGSPTATADPSAERLCDDPGPGAL